MTITKKIKSTMNLWTKKKLSIPQTTPWRLPPPNPNRSNTEWLATPTQRKSKDLQDTLSRTTFKLRISLYPPPHHRFTPRRATSKNQINHYGCLFHMVHITTYQTKRSPSLTLFPTPNPKKYSKCWIRSLWGHKHPTQPPS